VAQIVPKSNLLIKLNVKMFLKFSEKSIFNIKTELKAQKPQLTLILSCASTREPELQAQGSSKLSAASLCNSLSQP
jgi:hypothetical protein